MSICMPFLGLFLCMTMVSLSSGGVHTEELETQRYMVRQRGSAGHSRAGLVFAAKRRQSGFHIDSFFSEPLAIITNTKDSHKTQENRDALLLMLGKAQKHIIRRSGRENPNAN
jgi:hypothetical protein